MPATSTGLLLDRIAPENRQKLETVLTIQTASVLRQMGVNKLLAPVVTQDTISELIAAGYAKQVLGGLRLTDVGHVRAMMENGQ